jgi:hypothetical protein
MDIFHQMPLLPFLLLAFITVSSVVANNAALNQQRADEAAAAEYANSHPCATQTTNTSILTSSVVCVNGTLNSTSFNRPVFFNGTFFNGTFFNSTFLNSTMENGTNVSCSIVYIQIGNVFNYHLSNGNDLVINTVLGQILPWSVCPRPLTAEEIAARDAEIYAKAMDQLKLMGIIGGSIGFTLITCRIMCLTQCCRKC